LVDQLRALDEVNAVSIRSPEEGMTNSGDIVHLDLRLGDRKRALPAVIAAVEAGGAALEGLDLPTASWEDVAQRLTDARDADADPHSAPERLSDHHPRRPLLTPGASPAADNLPAQRDHAGQDKGPARRIPPRYRELLRTLPLFLKRDLQMQISYRLSFVLQFLGILFSIASFYFVGQVFGVQASPYLESYGGDYFSFVLIGIALTGYQSIALYAFSGVIQSAQSTGTLEAMLTTPTRLSTILLGSSMWNFVFTSFRVLLYLIAGVVFFGARFGGANLLAALVILVLTITSLGGIGILSASFIMVFKRGNPINFLLGSFSTLLGGVYYPVEVLPRWLQILARFYPLTYSLQAMRRALLTGASFGALARELGFLFAFSVVLLPLGLAAFRYAVQQAKRDGSLTQF
jgi:ABC-2 type transport system permease protein